MENNAAPEFQKWLAQWPDGLIAISEQGQISWFSHKARKILGWQDVSEKNVHDLLCIQSRGFEHEQCDCPLVHDIPASAATQSSYWLSASGEYVSVDFRKLDIKVLPEVASVISFVENMQADYNYAELTKFSSFVDKNPAAIAEFDRDGQMLFGNPSMQELLLNFGFDEFGTANIFPERFSEICMLCCQQLKSVTNEVVQVGDSWFSWHFHPLDDNREVNAIGYVFDTTQQKLAEQRASITRAEARRDFYAKMMHELRTPLNAIVGYSDLILFRSEANLSDRDKQALKGIKVGGMQLNELISDTLDISKIEAGKMHADMEEFSVSTILEEIYEQMHYLAEAKKLGYSAECNKDLVVLCDRRKVRQILVNLISNAIKYTKVGTVHVDISNTAKEKEAAYFSIIVTDTGVGIPEAQMGILFEAYGQVKEKKNIGIQGTGLGLALVKDLVSVLGGKIEVDSVYGEGTTFTVHLPICPDFRRA
ncbi:Signal transduction histidine kinase [Alteromonadaceae bacterium Bs31]|nr:Signal transduction histidine kinase [Alteromonadaceae bacterium Bs31]